MEVKAIKEGYHNHRYRKVGEIFELESIVGLGSDGKKRNFSPEDQFSEKWMIKTQDEEERPKAKPIAKKSKSVQDEEVI